MESNAENKRSNKPLITVFVAVGCCFGGAVFAIIAIFLAGSFISRQSTQNQQATIQAANLGFTDLQLMTRQGKYDEVLPYWDFYISEHPEEGNAYFHRAITKFRLSYNSRVRSDVEAQLYDALDDADKAIIYGGIDDYPGDPYNLRYYIYSDLSELYDYRSDRDYLTQIALDNLRMGLSLRNSQPYLQEWIPLMLFSLNRCEEGMDELLRIKESYGLSAPPSASMLNIEAQAYLCFGDLEKALEYNEKSLAVEYVSGRAWLRSIILHLMGRKEEALAQLEQVISETPRSKGDRYYFRALIHYESGDRDLAKHDLEIGSRYTWGQGGLSAYVLGRMALDDGDQEAAIAYLQHALATLVSLHQSMDARIEQELVQLGASPLPDEIHLEIQVTPMPAIEIKPTPETSTPLVRGFPQPPNIKHVNMETGTGYIVASVEVYPFPVYLFQSSLPISVESIQGLTIHLKPISSDESDAFEVFVWNLTNGEWDMLKPGWGAVSVENPGNYVDDNGDVYLSIRTDRGGVLQIENFWLTVELTQTDGTETTLGINGQ